MNNLTQSHIELPHHQQNREGASPFHTSVHCRSVEERQREKQAQAQAVQEKLFANARHGLSCETFCKPMSHQRPPYNTPQYWQDYARGWITDQEERVDRANFEARRKRAVDSKYNQAIPPHRHKRLAPRSTKQFSKPMSTQAARDDRLTPQSKALLQVLVARTGRGRATDTTKTTLGIIMSRCPRSIQRYLQELIKFGYIRTQTRKSKRTGFFIGLRIWIMNSVLPFYAKKNANYDPENWLDLVRIRRNSEETKESLTNSKDRYLNLFREKKPPWFAEYAF